MTPCIDLAVFLYAFPVIWVMSFLLHELCHCLEAIRQGNEEGYIKVFKWDAIPSFFAEASGGLKNPKMFKLAGGLYSGLLLLPLGIIGILVYFPIGFPLLSASLANIAYSFYERKFLWEIDFNHYMIGHYLLYGAVVLILAVIFRNDLCAMLKCF